MIIPETGTPFHKWYERKYGKNIGMTHSEIHNELKTGENKELLGIVKEYDKYFSEFSRKLWESHINYEILEDE